MVIRTKVFEFCEDNYHSLSALARAMGVSVSQVCRVRDGKSGINQKFIAGAIRAFPQHKLEDLFYFVSDR